MAFFKLRARNPQGNDSRSVASAPPAESVEAMRRRARHRLLGAAVLVLLGVIGFPLLFDTQPRPVAVDIPIEIPDRTKAKPLAVPAAAPPAASVAGGSGSGPSSGGDARVASAGPRTTVPTAGGVITEGPDGEEIAPSTPVPEPSAAKPEPRPEKKPEPKAEAKPKPEPDRRTEAKAEAKPETKPPSLRPVAPANDGARARALLEGKAPETVAATPATPTTADDKGRFVVQVGAFADAEKARETRQKLERAGLKTYTHVAKTAEGERTRVRVGPFTSRAEADRAAGRIKGLALPAAVLIL